MTIVLNHTILPARDKVEAARFFASIFGLNFDKKQSDHFAPRPRKRDVDAPL
jgi:predicted enzyme related to lactoylglutathione lyase